jgi:hypothetical protein
MASTSTEVIDLTKSTPDPIVISDEDSSTQQAGPEKRNKKRKRSLETGAGAGQCRLSELTAIHGEWDGYEGITTVRQMRKHLQEYNSLDDRHSHYTEPDLPSRSRPHSSDLFFIDVKPGLGVEGTASRDAVAVPKENEDEAPKLLLPTHVSVLSGDGNDIPVEILPPSDSDPECEDYIEYLDYDDGKVSYGTDHNCFVQRIQTGWPCTIL